MFNKYSITLIIIILITFCFTGCSNDKGITIIKNYGEVIINKKPSTNIDFKKAEYPYNIDVSNNSYLILKINKGLMLIYPKTNIIINVIKNDNDQMFKILINKGQISGYFENLDSVILANNLLKFEGIISKFQFITDNKYSEFKNISGNVYFTSYKLNKSFKLKSGSTLFITPQFNEIIDKIYDSSNIMLYLSNLIEGEIDKNSMNQLESKVLLYSNISIKDIIEYEYFNCKKGTMNILVTRNSKKYKGYLEVKKNKFLLYNFTGVKTFNKNDIKYILPYRLKDSINGALL